MYPLRQAGRGGRGSMRGLLGPKRCAGAGPLQRQLPGGDGHEARSEVPEQPLTGAFLQESDPPWVFTKQYPAEFKPQAGERLLGW